MSRPGRYLIPALLLTAAVAPAANPLDRRSRDEPEIVVEAGGRAGRCDDLRFTADGKWLMACGDDKVVRMWPYADGKLDTTKGKARVIRWPAWREQRGGIKAQAATPDGSKVLVGGFGMRSSTCALLDGETGDLLALTWPIEDRKEGGFFTVMAVAFPEDPKSDPRVAFATADGSVWLWDTTPLPDGKGKELPERTARPYRVGVHEKVVERDSKQSSFSMPRELWFENGSLYSISEVGQILKCDVPKEIPAGSPRDLGKGTQRMNINAGKIDGDNKHTVYRTARSADGNWMAVAVRSNFVLLRELSKGEEFAKIPLLNKYELPYCLAFDPKTGRLAIGVADMVYDTRKDGEKVPGAFALDGKGHVLVFDNPTGPNPKLVADIQTSYFPEGVAFHPTDGKLAVAAGENCEVTVHDVDKDKATSLVRGAGRGLWSVGLSSNGNVLGVRTVRDAKSKNPNARGTGDWHAFDLPRMKPTKAPEEWLLPVAEADGWKVVQNSDDLYMWHVQRTDNPAVQTYLTLDRRREMMPTCYTFIPAKGNTPTRLLVGHYYGASLFENDPKLGWVRKRLFTGHAGEVSAVVAAKDGTWFATCGFDQTVASFALTEWPNHPSLGASFTIVDGKLYAQKVDVGSPAWELGLSGRDSIETLAVNKKLIYNVTDKYPKVGTPEEAMAALGRAEAGIEHYVGFRRQGKGDVIENLSTVRQRPLWKWFPAFDDEGKLTDWIIWMWRGSYYHTKTAHGDRLVGWHVNHPQIDGKPEFYQLQQFEKQYHRPELLTKLIASRDLSAVMVAALGENPQTIPFDRYEPAPVRVSVQKTTVAASGMKVDVNVAARGTNPDLLPDRVELWINDYRHKAWDTFGRPVSETVELPIDVFRGGENQIAVQTFNRVGGRGEAVKLVTNPKDAAEPRLLGLSVGINDYAAHRVNATGARSFGDLRSARTDAEKIAEKMLDYRGVGKYFPSGDFMIRLDGKARRQDLLAALDEYAKTAKADDHLIVFFAGHGDFVVPEGPTPGGEPVEGARGLGGNRGLFLFCCPDYAPAKPQQTALAAEELFDKIATIKCKKMILLDACHSGQATEANLIRRFVPNGHGPFVMASSDQSELSYEHPKFGHGLFTYAVMEALGDRFRKADRDTDGTITTVELYKYVADRVPELLREAGKDGGLQNPICFPRDATRTVFVKK